MEKNFANLIEIDKNEVLRYLEYNGQYIDEKLDHIIDECIKITKQKINPRYTLGVYSILKEKIDDSYQIKFKDSNISIKSKDLYKLLGGCRQCILLSTTLGIDIEKQVKFYLDDDFHDEDIIGMHPNDNTATLWLKVKDLKDIIKEHGNEVYEVKL